jgi:competence protein ComFC
MVILFEDLARKFFSENNISPGIADLVVPVPLHPARRHKRGFNQSELISYILSGLLSSPVSTHALIKTKNTEPQMGLSSEKRVVNLKNSFTAVDRMLLTGKSVILVDDIMTTGATLDTCAKELLRSGAKEVYAFTLARTL